MKLYISDINLFDEAFFEKADFVPKQKKIDLASYSHAASKKEHILAWSVLSHAYKTETGKSVPEISLEFSEKGKPYLKSSPFFFSLSHSYGRIICAVSENEIGADIQQIKPVKDGVVRRVLSENERMIYENQDDKPLCFTKLWTLKESYVKYTGEGITAGLSHFDFSPVFESESFGLFGKNFFAFSDSEYACSVCSTDENVQIIHIIPDDFSVK